MKEAFDRELASNRVNGPTCRPKSSLSENAEKRIRE